MCLAPFKSGASFIPLVFEILLYCATLLVTHSSTNQYHGVERTEGYDDRMDYSSDGKILSRCVKSPTVGCCPGHMCSYTFVVSQLLCVEIPLSFSAEAFVQSTGISCNESGDGSDNCDSDPHDCVKDAVRYRYERSSCNDKPGRSFRKNYYATYHNLQ